MGSRRSYLWLLAVSLVMVTFWATAAMATSAVEYNLTPPSGYGSSMTDLGTLGGVASEVYGINDSGQMVGEANAGYAFLYSDGTTTYLGTLGGTYSGAYSINNSGQVVGWSDTSSGEEDAFLYSGGVMYDLGNLGGGYSVAHGISNNGDVVGMSFTSSGAYDAFLYSNGTMTDLGALGGASGEAWDINDSGEIVGWYTTASGDMHAYSYSDGTLTDLGTLGGNYSSASGINDNGQVVGTAQTSSGASDAFLYTPASDSVYYFTYYYNDGSGDYYTGYFYAPSDWFATGDSISSEPSSLGSGALTGYYYITDAVPGYSSDYDREEYITSFCDCYYTGYTSYTLYSSTGQSSADHSLYIANRSTTDEGGYVYDPSVPAGDAFFGNPEVTYYFSNSSDSNVGFLVKYYSDLPYWAEPSSYPNSSSETAGAILLAYWYQQGSNYQLLISDSKWQTDWPDSAAASQDSPASYVDFISTLASYTSYTSTSLWTSLDNLLTGLENYTYDQGYNSSTSGYFLGYVSSAGGSGWDTFSSSLNSEPQVVHLQWTSGESIIDYSAVARGYWNNGEVLVDFGAGLPYENVKLDYYQSSPGTGYTNAEIVEYMDFYWSQYGT